MKKGIIVAAVGGIIAGLALQFFSPAYRITIDMLLLLWEGIVWVWSTLTSSHQVPGYLIAIVCLLAILGISQIFSKVCSLSRTETEPDFLKYREDMVDGVKWRWDWNNNHIVSLQAFCPNCDAQLVAMESFNETHFVCERCSSNKNSQFGDHRWRIIAVVPGGGPYYALEVVEREILRRIRTNNYPDVSE